MLDTAAEYCCEKVVRAANLFEEPDITDILMVTV